MDELNFKIRDLCHHIFMNLNRVAANIADIDIVDSHKRLLDKQHSLQDVIDGRCLVGVEGDSGNDILRAKQLGLFTCNVKGIDIFAKCEEDARPLIHYLERGGVYGSLEFSRLLGYSDEEVDEYADYISY